MQTSGTSKGGSFGAAVSVANVRNDVTAGIYDSDISQVQDVQVHAYNATEIGAGAAMVAVSFSPDATTFSGSVVVNEITNHTTAEIVGSRVTAAQKVEVLAADQGADASLETAIDPEGKRNNVVAGLDYCGSSAGGATAGSSTGALGTVLMTLTGGAGAAGTGFARGAFFGAASAGPSTRPDHELVSAPASVASSSISGRYIGAMVTSWPARASCA